MSKASEASSAALAKAGRNVYNFMSGSTASGDGSTASGERVSNTAMGSVYEELNAANAAKKAAEAKNIAALEAVVNPFTKTASSKRRNTRRRLRSRRQRTNRRNTRRYR